MSDAPSTDLVTRLKALARAEHDDLSVAAEGAAEIERLRRHIDALEEGLEDATGTLEEDAAMRALQELD